LALKGNQGTLSKDVELFFDEQKAVGFKDTTIRRRQTLEKSHGRIETRTYTASNLMRRAVGKHSMRVKPAAVVVTGVVHGARDR
jgi:hypothetical protein